MLIHGGGGDAGIFQPYAELLADTYTVLTYDRRGFSRSPRPVGWASTTIAEHADDCAALTETLGLHEPVAVGTSLGGTITLALLERHADQVRGAAIHEPGLSVVSGKTEFDQEFQRLLTDGMERGGLEHAMELVGRWLVGSPFSEIASNEVLARGNDNLDLMPLESAAISAYEPDTKALAKLEVPVHALQGADTPHPWLVNGAEWVSEITGGPLHVVPGAHAPRLDQVPAFVEAVRPILASMS